MHVYACIYMVCTCMILESRLLFIFSMIGFNPTFFLGYWGQDRNVWVLITKSQIFSSSQSLCFMSLPMLKWKPQPNIMDYVTISIPKPAQSKQQPWPWLWRWDRGQEGRLFGLGPAEAHCWKVITKCNSVNEWSASPMALDKWNKQVISHSVRDRD